MQGLNLQTVEEARQYIESNRIDYIKIGIFDIDGVLRGKYISREKFYSALADGFGFCDVVLGWDSSDKPYDNTTFTGLHTGYPDAKARIIPESGRRLPWEDNTCFFLCEFTDTAEAICPRQVLKRVLAKANALGFNPYCAFEYEFVLFNETTDSAKAKGYKNLEPISPDMFGYSVIRNSVFSEYYHELLDVCQQMDIPLEGLHTETGPGVLEAAISVTDGLASADRAALFKTVTKIVTQRCGWMATFMAKLSADLPGQGGHVHVSLQDQQGRPIFYDEKGEHQMSAVMRQFVAGLEAYMPELTALCAPTINAYRRFVPGSWAPTHSCWAVENRTAPLRVIPGSAKSQRVESRFAAADANPYLCLAAVLTAGLAGVEQQLSLGEPVAGNAYASQVASDKNIPQTLSEATQCFSQSALAKQTLGETFVQHYTQTREWECQEFQKSVTDWELARYFEII